MQVFFACMCVCAPHACLWCLWRSEEDTGFLKTGVIDGYVTPCRCWEANPDACFTAESSLQPQIMIILSTHHSTIQKEGMFLKIPQ